MNKLYPKLQKVSGKLSWSHLCEPLELLNNALKMKWAKTDMTF